MPRIPVPQKITPPRNNGFEQEAAIFADAVSLHESDRLAEAKSAYEFILRSNPNHPEILTLLGTLHLQQGNAEEAIRLLDLSLRIHRNQPRAHNSRGIALCKVLRYEAALADFDRAIVLGLPEASYGNRANALAYLARYDEALAAYDQAFAVNPADPELHYNRGSALLLRRDHDAALASYDRAIALRPDYADAHFARAELLLLLGDFANGWKQFEWRWKLPEAKHIIFEYPKPLWLGEPDIAGKTILLHGEQGFGDMLQFCRYVEMVAARQAEVVLGVPTALKRLMMTLRGSPLVVDDLKDTPLCDFHCPLMSLPLALGTTSETIPANVPYLFSDKALSATWSARLGVRNRPQVGLVWFGSIKGGKSYTKAMSFEDIVALTDCDADFYALQKQQTAGDEMMFQRSHRVTDLGPELNDFADTAAVIMQLDLVISVDTSVAHLAGALGKPVWILLSHLRDWRWLRDGPVTPWYPTARLFRQTAPNDWATLIGIVKHELARWTEQQTRPI